jgi:hypothetical protein
VRGSLCEEGGGAAGGEGLGARRGMRGGEGSMRRVQRERGSKRGGSSEQGSMMGGHCRGRAE